MTDIQNWLDKGGEIESKATDGPWGGTWNGAREGNVAGETDVLDATNVSARDLYFITEARTRLPQALNALQAVLDLHKKIHPSAQRWRIAPGSNEPQPVTIPDTCDYCRGNYPCPTVRAITDAIND